MRLALPGLLALRVLRVILVWQARLGLLVRLVLRVLLVLLAQKATPGQRV